MRHLTIDQARAALRRGTTIEQLLAGGDRDGRAVVRWLSLIPTKTGDIEIKVLVEVDSPREVEELSEAFEAAICPTRVGPTTDARSGGSSSRRIWMSRRQPGGRIF